MIPDKNKRGTNWHVCWLNLQNRVWVTNNLGRYHAIFKGHLSLDWDYLAEKLQARLKLYVNDTDAVIIFKAGRYSSIEEVTNYFTETQADSRAA